MTASRTFHVAKTVIKYLVKFTFVVIVKCCLDVTMKYSEGWPLFGTGNLCTKMKLYQYFGEQLFIFINDLDVH